jgi:tetraacyldisaccharide 4'-kinase
LESEAPVDVFLLDDGFQHRELARDLDILMIDGSRDLKRESMLPSGMLREPVSAARRADILVVSRGAEKVPIDGIDSKRQSVFYAQTRLVEFRRLGVVAPELKTGSTISRAPSFAFCGVGNPDAFFADLVSWRVELAGERAFRDHHAYSEVDVEHLEAEADKVSAADFVTTEKDAANLAHAGGRFRRPVWVAVIDFVFSAENELVTAIERVVKEKRGVRGAAA